MNDSLKNESNKGAWLNFNAEAEYFDPYEGLIDLGSATDKRNIRYGYSLSGQNLLTGKGMVSEVISNPVVYPLPGMPKWIKGLINLRGNLVPAFDVVDKFNKTGGSQQVRSLLVLDKGERAVGLYIDYLPVSMEIDDESLVSIPAPESTESILNEFIQATYSVHGDVWHEIDYDAFFSYLIRVRSDQSG